ncbi:MAG: hypothetical protein JXD23_11120 [Spirochaetales bacterium]|nr:hypothetical protein [Spirochaetales bacterium]
MMKRISLLAAMVGALALTGCVISPGVRRPYVAPRPAQPVKKPVKVVGPPSVVIGANPVMVVIPGTYVYWLDGYDDVFFYGGTWWRLWGGNWYRATVYSGAWVRVEARRVPHPVTHLPSGWRRSHRNAPRVHWGDARTHWRSWEKDRYWHRRKWRK